MGNRLSATLAWSVLLTAAAALLPAAAAHAESEAPSLRPDVLAAGHEPANVLPHSQWRGFLRLAPESNVTSASYQVCRVGQACFAPPTPAVHVGSEWRFDTAGYTVNGKPVDYQPGWRLGVKWWLTETRGDGSNVAVEFPAGPDASSPECQGDGAAGCAEQHYLAFGVVDNRTHGLPAPGPLAVLGVVAVGVAFAGRRRRSPLG